MNFPDPSLPPILIVDDSQDDAFTLRYRLRQGGIVNAVATVETTEAALSYLRSAYVMNRLPQLLFVDIKMRGGFDMVSRLRSEPGYREIKVVVVTYSNQPGDLKRGLELGIDGYIMKFPDADILAEFVHHGPWFDVSHRRAAQNEVHALSA